jgi:hypothetical protein
VACFSCKQVTLGFLSLASRLMQVQQRVVHVASSWRLRRVEAKDGQVDAMGCVRTFYSKIIVFYVLDHMDNLAFNFYLSI